MNLNWLYTAISFIMLRWRDVFSFLADRTFLGTNWDWILAIIFLVITIRIVLFPLFVKQIKSQRAMQALQPQLKELQEKHKGDRETLQKEVMELYRREKANPLMGCLPIFLQVPVFISLFWILGRRLDPGRVDKVNAGFPLVDSKIELYGWTFAQYDSASHATLFNAPIAATFMEVGWFERDLDATFAEMGTSMLTVRLVAGVLTLIMVATTFLTSRQMVLKTGWATDQTQLMMQRLMVYGLPFMLLFSGAFFPISVILYWVVNNLFSLGQQQWVLRKYPPPPSAKTSNGAAKAGDGARQQSGKGTGKSTGKGTGKGTSKGTGKSTGKDAAAPDQPAIDGRKLAPKPGAKPSQPKRVPPKGIPPTKAGGSGAQSIPPKRKVGSPSQNDSGDGSSPAKAAGKPPGKASGKASGKPAGAGKPSGTGKSAGAGKGGAGKSAGAGNGGKAAGRASGSADQDSPTGDGAAPGKGTQGSAGRTSSKSWPAPPPFELGRRSD